MLAAVETLDVNASVRGREMVVGVMDVSEMLLAILTKLGGTVNVAQNGAQSEDPNEAAVDAIER
jgi:hypothetical protein